MPARPRRWHVEAMVTGEFVRVRNYLTPDPGENLTDDPPTQTLTWAEWTAQHNALGLTIDGQVRTDAIARRQARQRLKTRAATNPDLADLIMLLTGQDILNDPDPPDPS